MSAASSTQSETVESPSAPGEPSRESAAAQAPASSPAVAGATGAGAPCPPCEGDDTVVLTPTDHPSEAVAVHVPVGVRSASLALIALCAALAVLHWAAAVFIPIAMSALLICALSPVVGWLHRHRVPRGIGAALLLLGLSGGLAGTVYQLSDGASQVVDSLPKAASKVRDKMRERARQPSPLETVQKAASQIEQAAAETTAPSVARRGVQRVQIERSPVNIRDYLWSGTMGLMSVLGQLTIVFFLSFFALAAGNTFRLKLMRIAGRSLARRKVTLQVIDEINGQVQRYLLVQLVTSAAVGVATGLAYAILGLENAAVWGVIAAVLNLAPYIGSVVVTGASALVAFLQFGSTDMALVVGGVSLVIHTLVGNLLTPWLTSRTSSLSPVAVFVSVLIWGWLWGLWGLLLGIPIMMAVRAVCDRVEDLHAVGELLGN